jgi:hypothetical protein
LQRLSFAERNASRARFLACVLCIPFSSPDLEDGDVCSPGTLEACGVVELAQQAALGDAMRRRRAKEREPAADWAMASEADEAKDSATGDSRSSSSSSGHEVAAPPLPKKSAAQQAKLAALLQDARRAFPLWAWAVVVVMTGYTVLYALLKRDVFNPCHGSLGFWLWQFTPVPVLGACMYGIAVFLNQLHERREAAGYLYLETDIQFSRAQLWKFPVTALNAGLAAGLLGIGGGMVIGPLFIEIGMQPQVGTSSCAYMILWTALSGVIQYYTAGKLGWKFAFFFGCMGFVSGQIGQTGVTRVLKLTGRPSIVVTLLGGIIGLACFIMVVSLPIKLATSDLSAAETFALETDWATCEWSSH